MIRDLCEGLDLRCCMDCGRWGRNVTTPPTAFDRFIRPMPTDSGKCPDWKPIPVPPRKPEDAL